MNISHLYHSTKSARAVKQLFRAVERIGRHEQSLKGLSQTHLMELLDKLRQADAATKKSPAWLEETFAVIREMSHQTLGLRQHDVQLVGGLVLYHGQLAEMRTGEGKTLTIAAPCIAAALSGQVVHVVTVNEYLAQRDADTLKPLYEAFGLKVGVIRSGQSIEEKQAAYTCDIVYGVNHEFGFDYLRDNMVLSAGNRVQRGLGFVVVDEVDSILIDEARTPLIISGQAPDVGNFEIAVDDVVRQLSRDTDYVVNEKEHAVNLTEAGYSALEKLMVTAALVTAPQALYKPENLALLQEVGQALRAHTLYRRDKHYVVQNDEIVIVDEATGRLMAGRRWGEGLHEAVEAKERVAIKPKTQTQATITYQNFFSLYQKLAGLTGTAATEAEEFAEIYNLDTVVIPTNKPVVRTDLPDVVFSTRNEKFAAIVAEVARRHATGQPVLVGTASVADSERISALLQTAGLPHSVLNARQNAQEADVVAGAGLPGAVTVATNMAGRGTDILLGGHRYSPDDSEWQERRDLVVAAGGLHVLGTERHESRRVDNQLRGRAGRQGDVGSSQFFISLEDKLLRVFAADRQAALAKLIPPGEGLSHQLLDKVVSMAQKRMEEQGFQARRDLLKYDRVLAAQRLAFYGVRNELLEQEHEALVAQAEDLAATAADKVTEEWLDTEWLPDDFDVVGFKNALSQTFAVTAPVISWVHQEDLEPREIRVKARELVAAKAREWATNQEVEALRATLLQELDQQWVRHLTELAELQVAIGLRVVAQQNPGYAFAQDAKRLFEALRPAWAFEAVQLLKSRANFTLASSGNTEAVLELTPTQRVQLTMLQRFVTRNEACPCGSGHRFKACHGRL
jgi:preprotein translocase subunit SecA